MKAIVAHGAGDLRIEDRPEVPRTAKDVRIRVTHGGICGSDIHYYKEGRVGAFSLLEPLVLGHEVVGRVVEDGRATGAFAVGTPVTIHPATYNPALPGYQEGRPNISSGVRYLGSAASTPHTQGAFSEYFTVSADQVKALPADLPLERAVLAEPLAVVLHAINRGEGVQHKDVFVSGAGPIGLLAARAAICLGARSVSISDVVEHPLELARLLEVTGTYLVGAQEIPSQQFDLVIEASGAPRALGQAIRAVKSGGTIVQVGMLPGEPSTYALAEMVSREIDLRGSFRFDNEIDEAIDLLRRDPTLGEVVTHTLDADDVIAAFDLAVDSARSGKVVLRLWNDDQGEPALS